MAEFTGTLKYGGYTLSNENINAMIYWCNQYNILPSGMICQNYLETHWGNAGLGRVTEMHNWGGITWFGDSMFGGKVPYEKGKPRPAKEGGYYVKFNSLSDFFHAQAWLLSSKENGGAGKYNVDGKDTVYGYATGLFIYGGAKANYAESWEGYAETMVSIERGILANNPNFNDVNSSSPIAPTGTVKMVVPVKNATADNVTQLYGWRTHPITGKRNFHRALDIANGCGIGVVSSLPGTVIRADVIYVDDPFGGITGYGNVVEIKHTNGYSTLYAHLDRVFVEVGDVVPINQVIGSVGSTGSSTGCHLHFELKKEGYVDEGGGNAIDPYPYIFGNQGIDLGGGTPIQAKRKKYKWWIYH